MGKRQKDEKQPVAPDMVIKLLCRLPLDFRMGNSSMTALVEASGYLHASETLTRESVGEVLKGDRSLVDEWELYSENQRCDGWVFREENGQYEVFRASTEGATEVDTNTWVGGRYVVHERFTFDDRTEACAEYVVREIQLIARSVNRSN